MPRVGLEPWLLRRAVVFLVLGPASVAFTFLLMCVTAGGAKPCDFEQLCAAALFLFALPVSAITGPIDSYLARALPLALRAPLTAIAGAAAAVGLLLALNRMMFPHGTTLPLEILTPFAIGGAVCMGACSLLSHDYGKRQQPGAQRGGLTSNAG